ncbi:MAG: hypothetical protein AB8B64_10205 [Granulosicoccus sp.]
MLDGEEITGAVYIYRTTKADYDACVKSWVIASRSVFDKLLLNAVSAWFVESWPFDRTHYERR